MGERRSIKALFSPAVSLGAAGRDVFYEHGDGDIGLVCLYVEVGGVQVALDRGAARRVDAHHNFLQPLGAELIFFLAESMLIISRPDHNSVSHRHVCIIIPLIIVTEAGHM